MSVALTQAIVTDLLNDAVYSLRSLARAPIWTLTLVLTIALGIGSTAAVQGFVRGLTTTDLPIMGIERVVTVFAVDRDGRSAPVPVEAFDALQTRTDLFQSLGAIRESQERVTIGRRSSLMSVAAFSADVATVLPLPSMRDATLSHRLRFAQFPADGNPAGTALRIGDRETVIGGAMPFWLEGLYRGRSIDVWRPLDAGDADQRGRLWLLGRLRDGITPAAARAALAGEIRMPDGESIALVAYTGQTPESAAGMVRVGAVLQLAAAIVFAIACANVAAFLLTRAAARARETAVRVAIGARRRQLIRQLLADSAVIALIGGAAGFVLARWMADIVPLMFFVEDADRLVFSPDARGILLTAIAGVAVTIACGLAPLAETRDDEPSSVLQREIAGPSRRAGRVSTALILIQMAGCTLLVMSSGLLLQGYRAALDTTAGRRLGNPVLVAAESLQSASKAEMGRAGSLYFDGVVEAARSVTPISATVWASALPGSRPSWQWVRFDPATAARRDVQMALAPFTPATLEHVALPPVSGRLFGAGGIETCRSVVINEAAATALFTGFPIGRLLQLPSGLPLEVIGVVRAKDPRAAPPPVIFDHSEAAPPIAAAGTTTFIAPPAEELESGLIDVTIVSPNYFEAMGLTKVAGELFEAERGGCRIGVVNEAAAERWFGGEAVGGAVIDATGRRTEIVGVVRSSLLRSEQRLAEPTLFLPRAQDFLPRMMALLTAADDDASTLQAMRDRISQVPGGRPNRLIVTTLDAYLSDTALAPDRIAAVLVAAFAVVGILLGAIGLYGGLADSTRRRQREFAVKLALGAQGWRVVRQLIKEGVRLAAFGAAAGMLGALLVARWLESVTPGAGWPSPITWIAAPLLLVAAVVLASAIPARRATAVDLLSLMRDM